MDSPWKTYWGQGDEPPDPPPKCTCGVTITMGKDDHWHFHSDYCPVYEKGKKDADVQKKN